MLSNREQILVLRNALKPALERLEREAKWHRQNGGNCAARDRIIARAYEALRLTDQEMNVRLLVRQYPSGWSID